MQANEGGQMVRSRANLFQVLSKYEMVDHVSSSSALACAAVAASAALCAAFARTSAAAPPSPTSFLCALSLGSCVSLAVVDLTVSQLAAALDPVQPQRQAHRIHHQGPERPVQGVQGRPSRYPAHGAQPR